MKTRNLRKPVLSAISLLMAAWMLSVSAPLSYAEDAGTAFVDVTEVDWFYGDVEYAFENGIINGVGDDRFAPNGTMTRAMAVTMLYRMAGEPDVGEVKYQPFDDVPLGQWYTDAIVWAKWHGIVNGYDGFEFGPDDNVIRSQFSVMLFRYASHKKLKILITDADASNFNLPFRDKSQISGYAKLPVSLLSSAGIINGKDNGIFDPYADITRAEAAAMLHRFDLNTEYQYSRLLEEYGIYIEDVCLIIDYMPKIDVTPPTCSLRIELNEIPYNKIIPAITMSAKVTLNNTSFDVPLILNKAFSWFEADDEDLRPLSRSSDGDPIIVDVMISVGENTETLTFCFAVEAGY